MEDEVRAFKIADKNAIEKLRLDGVYTFGQYFLVRIYGHEQKSFVYYNEIERHTGFGGVDHQKLERQAVMRSIKEGWYLETPNNIGDFIKDPLSWIRHK